MILTPELWPTYGGIGNYVMHIARNIPRDVEIEIVMPRLPASARGNRSPAKALAGVLPSNTRITHLGGPLDSFSRQIFFQWMCKDYVKSAVRTGRTDVVHSASNMPDFLISPKRLRVPLISTVHTTIRGHYESLRSIGGTLGELSPSERLVFLLGPALSKAENTYYTNDRYYLTVSEWAKRQMTREKHVDPSKIRVINIGVDTEIFSPEKERFAEAVYPALADIEEPKVLYLSRMAARKGISLLLKAIPRILQKVDVHFVFAGAGKKPNFAVPERHYTYLGHVPNDCPPYLYAMSDVYVLPSLYENFPACILEAMASECAVVSTEICGIPEMIQNEENGFMIPPNDVNELSRILIHLVENDDLRKRIGKKARNHVVQKFSWEMTSRRTKEYYEEVVEGHKQGIDSFTCRPRLRK